MGNETQLAILDLEARVEAMRRLGVTRWAEIELGPVLSPSSPEQDATQRSEQLDRQKQEAAQRVRLLKFGASGGPRPADAPHR